MKTIENKLDQMNGAVSKTMTAFKKAQRALEKILLSITKLIDALHKNGLFRHSYRFSAMIAKQTSHCMEMYQLILKIIKKYIDFSAVLNVKKEVVLQYEYSVGLRKIMKVMRAKATYFGDYWKEIHASIQQTMNMESSIHQGHDNQGYKGNTTSTVWISNHSQQ
ncbi:hypothetical protein [Longirhabdus pacifica]|uniref:hypothetical protein n=1 Tax=Longirhabdus pacifica TaxID=2305227 RepID=UPI0010090E4D|nr:hypothetical protein [Longirhabdus pacifica]